MASTAKFLLEKGADPTRKNKYGTTALHFAARTGNDTLTRKLVDLPNVNVNETDSIGSQVLNMMTDVFIWLKNLKIVMETKYFSDFQYCCQHIKNT